MRSERSRKIEDEKGFLLKRTNFGLVRAVKMVWTKRVEPDGADGSDPGREEQISQACMVTDSVRTRGAGGRDRRSGLGHLSRPVRPVCTGAMATMLKKKSEETCRTHNQSSYKHAAPGF